MGVNKPLRVMCCRSASVRPLRPGAKLGYKCAVCDEDICVSPSGQERLKQDPHWTLMCEPCGFRYAQKAENMGKLSVQIGASALEQLKEMEGRDTPASAWVREQLKKEEQE